jgi:carboxyl-terminal processing protease
MPDIFIPMDTSSHYRYYNRLRRTNVVYNYVLDYVDQHRTELKNQYPEFEAFKNNFEVAREMIDSIISGGEKEGIEKDEESLTFTLPTMKKEIKALIARDIFSLNDYFKILYQDDEAILKALEVIENKEYYNNILVSVE